jgi:hypothetical protein
MLCTRPKARGSDGLEQVEHLLCKHAVISPKPLNRRLLTVQTPLQVGLLNGLHTIIRVRCPSLDKHSEKWTRFEASEHNRKNDLGLLSAIAGCVRIPSNPARLCNHCGRLRRHSRSAKRGSERKGSQSGSTLTLARKRKERSS